MDCQTISWSSKICLKRVSPAVVWAPETLWASMDKCGSMWICMDDQKSCVLMDMCGHVLCTPTCAQIWMRMDDQICVNLWACTYSRGHIFVSNLWACTSGRVGAPIFTRPYNSPTQVRVGMPIFTRPLPTKLFTRRLRLVHQVFQKIFSESFGNQQVTTLYLQRPKSTSAGV